MIHVHPFSRNTILIGFHTCRINLVTIPLVFSAHSISSLLLVGSPLQEGMCGCRLDVEF